MRAWLADYFRSLGAPWYWNARKSVFVLRGRRGACPCHDRSDSGLPGETRCEAMAYWRSPERFARNVCPLLVRNSAGNWRCSVGPESVRPFWLRPLKVYGLTASVAAILAGGGLWGTMRAVGYDVSLRQVFWPLAWDELPTVRSEFFRRQATEHLEAGRFREAMASLSLAQEMNPTDYATAMYLAQVHHLTRPEHVDALYRRIYDLHPDKRDETARVWFRSLLARAQLAGVADLARRRLVESPGEWHVWVHALLFVSRAEKRPEILIGLADDARLPESARAVVQFELRLRRMPRDAAKAWMLREPWPKDAYAALQRVERLLEWGDSMEALAVLGDARSQLQQRDIVRLTLAALAVGRNDATLMREARGLLSRRGEELAAAVALIGQHLVRYPNEELLRLTRDVARAIAAEAASARGDALAAVYCAAALSGRADWLPELRGYLAGGQAAAKVTSEQRVEQKLAEPNVSPLVLLSVVRPMSLELNYAVLERALAGR